MRIYFNAALASGARKISNSFWSKVALTQFLSHRLNWTVNPLNCNVYGFALLMRRLRAAATADASLKKRHSLIHKNFTLINYCEVV